MTEYPEEPEAGEASEDGDRERSGHAARPAPSWGGNRCRDASRRSRQIPPSTAAGGSSRRPIRADLPRRRERLTQLLDSVKRRGWPIYIFEPAAGTGPPAPGLPGAGGPLITDEGRRRAYLARLEDTVSQFPQVDGVILDGPEWGYEIAAGPPLRPLPRSAPRRWSPRPRPWASTTAAGRRRSDRLHQRLHKLNREVATLSAGGGVFSGLSLIGNDPGIVSWFTFRSRALTAFYRHVHPWPRP